MALCAGLWEGLCKTSENLWKPLETSANLWNPPSQRSSQRPSQRPLRGRFPSQNLSGLLPLIVLPLNLSPRKSDISFHASAAHWERLAQVCPRCWHASTNQPRNTARNVQSIMAQEPNRTESRSIKKRMSCHYNALAWLPLQSLAVKNILFLQILGGEKLLEKCQWNIFKRPERV